MDKLKPFRFLIVFFLSALFYYFSLTCLMMRRQSVIMSQFDSGLESIKVTPLDRIVDFLINILMLPGNILLNSKFITQELVGVISILIHSLILTLLICTALNSIFTRTCKTAPSTKGTG